MLIVAFDLVDDTVLLKKMIVNEMADNMFELAADPSARKVLLYLAAHRSRKHFLPVLLNQLAEYQDNEHSKKDADVRFQELLAASSPTLLKLVAEHAAELCREGQTALLVHEILLNCTGTLDLPSHMCFSDTSFDSRRQNCRR